MSMEQLGLILNTVGLLITLFGGGFWLSYHFGQTLNAMSNMNNDIKRMERDLRDYIAKEDSTHTAMWSKIDDHSQRIAEHSQKFIAIENRYKDFKKHDLQ